MYSHCAEYGVNRGVILHHQTDSLTNCVWCLKQYHRLEYSIPLFDVHLGLAIQIPTKHCKRSYGLSYVPIEIRINQ
jgi:hypothetical protein